MVLSKLFTGELKLICKGCSTSCAPFCRFRLNLIRLSCFFFGFFLEAGLAAAAGFGFLISEGSA